MTMMWKAAAAFILAIGAGGFVAGSVLGDSGPPEVGDPVVLNKDGQANQPGSTEPTARTNDDDGTADQGGSNDDDGDDDEPDTVYHSPDDLDDDDGRGRGRGRGGDDRDDDSGHGSDDSGSGIDDSGDDDDSFDD